MPLFNPGLLRSPLVLALLAGVNLLLSRVPSSAQDIGLQALRQLDPTLTGSGIIIAQPEADFGGVNVFEVNPAAVGQSASKFIYVSGSGTATTFPNALGSESGHADTVGDYFYGDTNTSSPEGIAPGVSQVYNYNASYFFNNLISANSTLPARIVNQSFIFTTGTDTTSQASIERTYDTYAANHNTLFISGAGDGGAVLAPASAYNGIAVGAYGGQTSTGPTYDGRSKPDIVAPSPASSYSTGQVSGAAAILLQAAARGDAGSGNITAASDTRTLKALILNGAVKPADWTHTATAPLDPTYGSGILNVDISYLNLAAGRHTFTTATSGSASPVSTGTPLPDEGWDLATITNTRPLVTYVAQSDHYLFDLTAATGSSFTLSSTLTWNRQANQTSINNLDLFLFDATSGTLIALSDSTIDNVEQLLVPGLAPGNYDLVVEKNGGSVVTASETFALAYNFIAIPEPSSAALLSLAAILPFSRLGKFRRR